MGKRLRVLEVNKAYYPHIGGIETLVRQYTEELGQLEGVEVRTLVCRDGRGRTVYERVNGAEKPGQAAWAPTFRVRFRSPS